MNYQTINSAHHEHTNFCQDLLHRWIGQQELCMRSQSLTNTQSQLPSHIIQFTQCWAQNESQFNKFCTYSI